VTAVEGSSANVHDVTVASKLLRPDDHVMYGDSAYLGLEKREEIVNHPTLSGIESRENRRPGNTYRKYANDGQAWEKEIERQKSAVRSMAEFTFRFLKVQCGFRKTVYKGIMKNLNRAFMPLASCNLYACAKVGRSLQSLIE
jgi:IS5 family transposase